MLATTSCFMLSSLLYKYCCVALCKAPQTCQATLFSRGSGPAPAIVTALIVLDVVFDKLAGIALGYKLFVVQASKCSGTPVHTSSGKPWSGCTGAVCVMALPSAGATTTTCIRKTSRSLPTTSPNCRLSSIPSPRRNSHLSGWK